MRGPMQNKIQSTTGQKGVVLIEALVSILLFSLGVLALVGLQAALLRHSTEARSRAEAMYIAQKALGEMWVSPANAGGFTKTVPVPTLPNATLTIESPNTQGEYEIKVSWLPGNETIPHTVVVVGNVVENPK